MNPDDATLLLYQQLVEVFTAHIADVEQDGSIAQSHRHTRFKFSTCASFGTFSIPVFVLVPLRSQFVMIKHYLEVTHLQLTHF